MAYTNPPRATVPKPKTIAKPKPTPSVASGSRNLARAGQPAAPAQSPRPVLKPAIVSKLTPRTLPQNIGGGIRGATGGGGQLSPPSGPPPTVTPKREREREVGLANVTGGASTQPGSNVSGWANSVINAIGAGASPKTVDAMTGGGQQNFGRYPGANQTNLPAVANPATSFSRALPAIGQGLLTASGAVSGLPILAQGFRQLPQDVQQGLARGATDVLGGPLMGAARAGEALFPGNQVSQNILAMNPLGGLPELLRPGQLSLPGQVAGGRGQMIPGVGGQMVQGGQPAQPAQLPLTPNSPVPVTVPGLGGAAARPQVAIADRYTGLAQSMGVQPGLTQQQEALNIPWSTLGFSDRPSGAAWANDFYAKYGSWPWEGPNSREENLGRNLATYYAPPPPAEQGLYLEPAYPTVPLGEAMLEPAYGGFGGGSGYGGYGGYGGGGGGGWNDNGQQVPPWWYTGMTRGV